MSKYLQIPERQGVGSRIQKDVEKASQYKESLLQYRLYSKGRLGMVYMVGKGVLQVCIAKGSYLVCEADLH